MADFYEEDDGVVSKPRFSTRDSHVYDAQEAKPAMEDEERQVSIHSGDGEPPQTANITKPLKRAKLIVDKCTLASRPGELVEREVLREVIVEDLKRCNGCSMIPLTVLFFTFYSVAFMLHEDVWYAHQAEAPIRELLVPGGPFQEDNEGPENTLDWVEKPADVWGVLDLMVDNFFVQTYTTHTGETLPLPREKWNYLNPYSKLVGPLLLTLQRSTTQACKGKYAEHMTCYPMEELNTSDFGSPLTEAEVEQYLGGDDPLLDCSTEGFSTTECGNSTDDNMTDGRRLTGYLRQELIPIMPKFSSKDGDSFLFKLHQNTSQDRLKERLTYLRNRRWIDEASTRLEAKAVLLNYNLYTPRLVQARVNFYFSRGGGVFTDVKVESVLLQNFSGDAAITFLILFGVMLFGSTIFQFVQLNTARRQKMVRYHCKPSIIVIWFTLFIGWVNTFGLLAEFGVRSTMNACLQTYFDNPSKENGDDVLLNSADLMFYASWLRVTITYAHLFFMARCFISLQWQPRLAVVAETLTACVTDLFHFLLVLIPTFFGFAIAGMMLFGRRLQEWSSLGSSSAMAFKLMIEGEYDWTSLSAADFGTASLWVLAFFVLVVLLMMNMVLAIICDVYQEVRIHSARMGIFEHIAYVFARSWNRTEWVSNAELLRKVSEMPTLLSFEGDIATVFPGMLPFQLEYLKRCCEVKTTVISKVGVNQSFTTQIVAAIHLCLEEIQLSLQDLKDKGWIWQGLSIENKDDRMATKEILAQVGLQNHWVQLAAHQCKHMYEDIVMADEDEDEGGRGTRSGTGSTRSMFMSNSMLRQSSSSGLTRTFQSMNSSSQLGRVTDENKSHTNLGGDDYTGVNRQAFME